MTRASFFAFCCVLGGILPLLALNTTDKISEKARALHFRSIVVDTHDDTTQRFLDSKFDLGVRHPDGNIDISRMREGGLDAIFFLIWIPGTVTVTVFVKQAF